MKNIRLRLGEPYIFECPFCRNLIPTTVLWGSGTAVCKKCNSNWHEIIRFDFISDKALKENQKKYKDLIEKYFKDEEDTNISDVL